MQIKVYICKLALSVHLSV